MFSTVNDYPEIFPAKTFLSREMHYVCLWFGISCWGFDNIVGQLAMQNFLTGVNKKALNWF